MTQGNVLQDTLLLLELDVILTVDVGEAPLARDDDLLAAGELVTGTAESLLNNGRVRILGTDGKNDLADVDTSDSAIGLAPSAAHTGLQTKEYESERYTPRLSANQRNAPISTSAGQHLVDTQDVEGVDADPQMERVLAGGLRDVFVGADTGSLKCFAGELLVLI